MNPTASALPRVLACVASAALPQAFDEGNRYSSQGDGVHGFILKARALGREKALELVPRDAPHRQFCEQLPLDEMPQGGRLEVAVAWDSETDTARILFEGEGRDYHRYNLKPTEWVGKIDLLGTVDGWVVVLDWKTGRYSHGPAGEAPQLLFGALAASRLTGIDRARLQFWYLHDDGTFWREPWQPAEVDALDLAEFADRLRALPGRIDAVREQLRLEQVPTVRTGPWCRYCPAKPYCPAKTSLARSMAGEIVTLRHLLGGLAPYNAGLVYAKAREIKDLASEVIDGIEDMAQVTPIPLPDGYVLKETTVKSGTKVNAEAAEAALVELFGSEVADKAIENEKRTTLTAITKALRPISPRGTLAENERRAFEAIRNRGGLREGTYQAVRRVKP